MCRFEKRVEIKNRDHEHTSGPLPIQLSRLIKNNAMGFGVKSNWKMDAYQVKVIDNL
jgi:hypothetical protein